MKNALITLNIGQAIPDGGFNSTGLVLFSLNMHGFTVVRYREIVADHDKGTEPTIVAVVEPRDTGTAITARIESLSRVLSQDCIAVRNAAGDGVLIGPKAAEWGEFNPEYFHDYGSPIAHHNSSTFLENSPSLPDDDKRAIHAREYLERRIVWNLILHMARHGWEPRAVCDGEGMTYPKGDAIKTMEAVFAVDEAAIGFCPIVEHGTKYRETKCAHDVVIVLGNGEDCIADWGYAEGDGDGFNAAMDAFDVSLYV